VRVLGSSTLDRVSMFAWTVRGHGAVIVIDDGLIAPSVSPHGGMTLRWRLSRISCSSTLSSVRDKDSNSTCEEARKSDGTRG
jgi:hypothetical protein